MTDMNARMKLIKHIREKTCAPISLIKEALDKFDNADAAAAVEWISKNWKAKNIDKEAPVGRIFSFVHLGKIGVMVELCCGTDFVANNQLFNELGKELTYQVIGDSSGKPLQEQVSVRDSSKTIQDMLNELSRETGESIKVARYIKWVVGV